MGHYDPLYKEVKAHAQYSVYRAGSPVRLRSGTTEPLSVIYEYTSTKAKGTLKTRLAHSAVRAAMQEGHFAVDFVVEMTVFFDDETQEALTLPVGVDFRLV